MDTDSLLVLRIATLMKQPNTVRDRTILWYASLNDKPGTRIVVVMLFVIFIMIHFIAFVALLKIGPVQEGALYFQCRRLESARKIESSSSEGENDSTDFKCSTKILRRS